MTLRKNVLAEKKEGVTLGEFFEVYMERHGNEKKSAKEYRSLYRQHLEAWKNFKLQEVTRHKIEALHRKAGEKTPIRANRLLALISSVFVQASLWGYHRGDNPCRGGQKIQGGQPGPLPLRGRARPVL